MDKPQVNYAFIDGNNLYLTMVNLGWRLDYTRFRIYLKEHYGVNRAYYFIGYLEEYKELYTSLTNSGFIMKFKEVSNLKDGKPKGNIDPELIMQAMVDLNEYEKAVIVSSDGDFACLVSHLKEKNKLKCVLAPCSVGCSHLLQKAAKESIYFIDSLRDKLEYKKKRTP